MLTEEWMKVFGDRLQEAETVFKGSNTLAGLARISADYAFQQQYPRRFRPFEDRYRVFPFFGLAFGEIQYGDRAVNFYVTRNSSGSLGLHLWDPRLRRSCYMKPGEPETTSHISY